MGAAFAFGFGVAVGAVAAFAAGRRYEVARQASILAAEHFGRARAGWRRAGGSVFAFGLVVVAGVAIMLFAA